MVGTAKARTKLIWAARRLGIEKPFEGPPQGCFSKLEHVALRQDLTAAHPGKTSPVASNAARLLGSQPTERPLSRGRGSRHAIWLSDCCPCDAGSRAQQRPESRA